MSAISASGQGLVQFLQGLSGSSAKTATSTSTTSPTATSALTNSLATGKAKGHHQKGNAGGFQKLLDTVTTALQSAQSSGSTADPNQTIETALEKIFKSGISAPSSSTSSASATSDTSDASAPSDAADAKQSFLSTLASFGVSPAQFQQDLATALKQANGGQGNPSTAFASFPTGSLLDAVG